MSEEGRFQALGSAAERDAIGYRAGRRPENRFGAPERQRTEVKKRYVSRIVRFAFLAPSVIEDIAHGHQLPEWTAQALSPPWRPSSKLAGSKELFGFASP